MTTVWRGKRYLMSVGMVAVAVLRIDPAPLRLPGLDAEALDLSLARAPDHFAVGRRPDAAGLAAGCLRPRLRRVIEAERHVAERSARTTVELSCCGP